MSNRWLFTGGAAFGKTIGDIYAMTAGNAPDLNNPTNTFRRGLYGNDVPSSVRLSAVYEFPGSIWVGAAARHNSGFPETTTVSVASNTIVLTQRTQVLTVEPRGTTRLPTVTSLDISVRRDWKVGGISIEPRVDFYSVTNAASILGRITQLGPT